MLFLSFTSVEGQNAYAQKRVHGKITLYGLHLFVAEVQTNAAYRKSSIKTPPPGGLISFKAHVLGRGGGDAYLKGV